MFENLLVEENDNILIAVSGGPDSMALLDRLREEQKRIDFTLSVAHVNHGLRKEADEEEKGLKDYCDLYGIPIYIKRLKKSRLTEEKARDLRYTFFNELIEKNHFNKLYTAHHQNDQAETVLLNLFRGSGPEGLEGIKTEREEKNYKIVRPFLSENKVAMRKYCVEHGVPFFEDRSNKECEYSRNFLRNRVLPLIETRFNGAQQKIADTSNLIALSNAFTDSVVAHYYKLWVKSVESGVRIDSRFFKDSKSFLKAYGLDYLSEAALYFLKLSLIRKMIAHTGTLKDVGFSHIKEILDFFENKDSGRLDLPGNLLAGIYSGFDEIRLKDKLPKAFDHYNGGKIDREKTFIFPKEKRIVSVKSSEALPKTFFRRRESGDKLQLKGFTKKLNRFLIDNKIPSYIRDSLILFTVEDKIEKVLDDHSCIYSNSDSIELKQHTFDEL